MLVTIDFVNHEHHWFVGFAQHSRQFLINWRQTFLRVDDEKKKIALAQRVFGGVPYLLGQFGFACAENSPSIPHGEWALATSAGCRKPVARDSGLVMNNRDLPADKA